MEVSERDLYSFIAIAGLWLKDRAPPVVRQALKISRECGIYTSAALFTRALERLVEAQWLTPIPYGRGMHRYVPTPRGLIDSHMILTTTIDRNESVTNHLSCLAKHVDVGAVARVSHVLVTLYTYSPFIAANRWPILGLPQDAQVRLQGVLRALYHNVPLDVHDVDIILQLEPVLNCNFEYYALHNTLRLVTSAETDSTPELVIAVKRIVEAMAKLARHCATHRAIPQFGAVADRLETLLRDKFKNGDSCQQ